MQRDIEIVQNKATCTFNPTLALYKEQIDLFDGLFPANSAKYTTTRLRWGNCLAQAAAASYLGTLLV